MEIDLRIRKEWDIADINCNVEEWECSGSFEVEDVQGYSVEGDFNLVTVEEVEALSGGDGSGRVQR